MAAADLKWDCGTSSTTKPSTSPQPVLTERPMFKQTFLPFSARTALGEHGHRPGPFHHLLQNPPPTENSRVVNPASRLSGKYSGSLNSPRGF